MPLFFASNAIYPIALMPSWLRVLSHLNPLTYEVDALRALMLVNGTSIYGVGLESIHNKRETGYLTASFKAAIQPPE